MTIHKISPLILASSSPRRRLLLGEAGYDFAVVEPPIEESDEVLGKLTPMQQAESLSYFKARCVADLNTQAWVLGADTIVALGGQVMGKPADARHARTMLETLSGTRHQVITGVSILGPDGRRLIASDVTFVTMRKMTPREIDDYVTSLEWLGKAGAYAIQETADRFVVNLEGSFSNVVGLPIELVARMFDELQTHG